MKNIDLIKLMKIECRVFGYNKLNNIVNLNCTFWSFSVPSTGDFFNVMGNYYKIKYLKWDIINGEKYCDIHIDYLEN